VLIVKEKSQNVFEEVPTGSSFVGSDGALHGWQCAEMWTDADLAKIGVYRVQPAPPPTDADVKIAGYHFERSGTAVVQIIDIIQPPAPTKDQLTAYAAAKRYNKEIGGMLSSTFGFLYTDRDTRSLIGQTIQSIDLGIVQAPINWKTPSGFQPLDRASLMAISKEVVAFVQAAFDRESEVDAKIADGTITTKAEIDAAFAP